MFKFLRTVAKALGRAGLKVMTNGVRADWLFCGRGFILGVRCCVRGLLQISFWKAETVSS